MYGLRGTRGNDTYFFSPFLDLVNLILSLFYIIFILFIFQNYSPIRHFKFFSKSFSVVTTTGFCFLLSISLSFNDIWPGPSGPLFFIYHYLLNLYLTLYLARRHMMMEQLTEKWKKYLQVFFEHDINLLNFQVISLWIIIKTNEVLSAISLHKSQYW